MKNNEVIRIAIAETSVIIRGGLTAALKRLPNAKVQPPSCESFFSRCACDRDGDACA